MTTNHRWRFLGSLVAGSVLFAAQPAWGQAGSLDDSFGEGGTVVTDLGGEDQAIAVAVQADGKVLAMAGNGTLVRYDVDGSLDTTFGAGGRITVAFVSALAVQPDGNILVAGFGRKGAFGAARYTSDGALDGTFGRRGVATVRFSRRDDVQALAVALQPDGKIVVGGNGGASETGFALARLNADGSLDDSFGTRGKVITAGFDGLAFNAALALQADGRIVMAGYTFPGGDFALARYNPDGSLDTTFDGDGRLTADFGGFDRLNDVAVQADGKIVAAAQIQPASGPQQFALARFSLDGSLDGTFDGDGKLTAPFSDFAGARALALQSDGKIVAAGLAGTRVTGPPPFDFDFAVVRYNTDGSLDTSFDGDGVVTTDMGGSEDIVNAMAIGADGKIVAAGHTGDGTNTTDDLAVARYLFE